MATVEWRNSPQGLRDDDDWQNSRQRIMEEDRWEARARVINKKKMELAWTTIEKNWWHRHQAGTTVKVDATRHRERRQPHHHHHHHHHHIFIYSAVATHNSSHRDENTQSLKTVNKQYKYECNDQSVFLIFSLLATSSINWMWIELIAVFVQHSYEKVSVVKFGCLVLSGVCSLP